MTVLTGDNFFDKYQQVWVLAPYGFDADNCDQKIENITAFLFTEPYPNEIVDEQILLDQLMWIEICSEWELFAVAPAITGYLNLKYRRRDETEMG